ncbi:MAG: hypothetical protein PHV20_03775 [Bacteroidales bacterium]|nr:hypothetical protein [Bacteroidales bacterium]
MKSLSTRFYFFLALIFMLSSEMSSQNVISLAGKWRIVLDGNYKDWPEKVGASEGWYKQELPTNKSVSMLNQIYFKNADFTVNDWINLPGSTDEAGIGAVLKESQIYTPGLERLRTYDGAFWVQRKVIIPESWKNKTVTLFMERTLGGSTVFWDNRKVGEDYGLAYPHIITIDKSIQSGEHLLTVLINKDDMRYASFGHHGYGGNGSSWNGIVGRIELIAKNAAAQIDNVFVYPQIKTGSVDVKLVFVLGSSLKNTKVKFSVRKKGEDKFELIKTEININDSLNTNFAIPKPVLLWSEFTPVLYELKCELESDGKTIDSFITTFGMREIGTKDGYITINGNNVFMRGTLDCGSFPLTGYPYMKKDKWIEIMKIIKSYGLNHVRYHTWCPPEAAFEAADEVGLYLQAELAGVPYAEINRILDTYGNHPSFCMLSLNNEVMGNTELNEKLVAKAKIKDKRHLYACTTQPVGVNRNDDYFISAWGIEKTNEWPFHKRIVGITWGGGDVVTASRFNLYSPETQSTFSSEIKGINVPIIAHEMGQWAMFPDFDEIPKYEKGVLRNTNYERIKVQIEKRGLLPYNKDFAKASGMLSSILYKEEIESILRTPNYGGFQLLDLHDYQGQYISIVGILNDFWESKGLVTPQKHSEYCQSVVPLAKMKKRVWTNDEQFEANVEISNFTFDDLLAVKPIWTVTDSQQNIIKKGVLNQLTVKKGGITAFSSISFALKNIKEASKVTLTVTIPKTGFVNSWEIWVYPKKIKENVGDVLVLNGTNTDILFQKLAEGQKVLLQLDKNTLRKYRESCFTTIFWNSIHKWMQKAHTMGILCDPKHQVFSDFPTDFYSNWQWWDITMNAYAMNMNDLPKEIKPLIGVIDSYIVNDKLAYLWECKVGNGKLMVCSVDFTQDMNNRPASKQLKLSILNYMNGNDFNPNIILNTTDIKALIK